MTDVLRIFSVLFLPALITIILVYGIIKKIPVYDVFISGAKEGLKTSVDILPFLIGIFIAIESMTASGAMDSIEQAVRPLFAAAGIPEELISLIFLRPVSGSGSLVVAEKIMQETGPDSFAGRAASVMVLYVLALYFGVTSVKKMRHAFISGIVGYVVGVAASVYICIIM